MPYLKANQKRGRTIVARKPGEVARNWRFITALKRKIIKR